MYGLAITNNGYVHIFNYSKNIVKSSETIFLVSHHYHPMTPKGKTERTNLKQMGGEICQA